MDCFVASLLAMTNGVATVATSPLTAAANDSGVIASAARTSRESVPMLRERVKKALTHTPRTTKKASKSRQKWPVAWPLITTSRDQSRAHEAHAKRHDLFQLMVCKQAVRHECDSTQAKPASSRKP
jgi:hypothetical protein